MITDHHAYPKAVKTRAQEITTIQDTPQDLERMEIAIAVRGIIKKNEYSNAKTNENKAIILVDYNYDCYKEIADCDCAGTICRWPPEQVSTPFYIAGRVHSRMEGPTT